MRLSIIALVAGFILLNACKKEPEDETPDPLTKAGILTASSTKKWLMKSETINGTDVTSGYQACELDNIHIFDNLSNYLIDAGSTKCQTNPEVDQKRGSWKFNANETHITFSFSDTTYAVELVTLTGSEFSWKMMDGVDEKVVTFKPY